MGNTESKNLAKNNQSPTISLQHEKFFPLESLSAKTFVGLPYIIRTSEKKKEIKFINKKDLNHIFFKDK